MITSVNPRTGAAGPSYNETTRRKLEGILMDAVAARDDYGYPTAQARAAALVDLAERLQSRGQDIIAICRAETGLGEARLTGELERTWRQALAFAQLVERGAHYEATIELHDPDARPVPRPDLRRMLVPRGPVAVYAASNFPLAFSVAGGDTVSALAAGCPVICKAHPSHPGTSMLVAAEIEAALTMQGLAAGMFALVLTDSIEMSLQLTMDDRVEAVAFTGSTAVGRALFDAAAARPRPVPVYAEMGSVNPVVVTAAAIEERGAEIAQALAGAVTRDAGQLCTKPGLIFVPASTEGEGFTDALRDLIAAEHCGPMLNQRLLDGAMRAESELNGHDAVRLLGRSDPPPDAALAPVSAVFATATAALRANPSLHEERFGPLALVATYTSRQDLLTTLAGLPGQLTATLQIADSARDEARDLVAALLPRVGRLLFNGVPTGVSVTAAMHHGGPYPATTDAAHTSVGTAAIRRFLRPVVWQNAPPWLLPEPLQS